MTQRTTWDRRHAEAKPPAPPSDFVAGQARACAKARPGGRALDLACGSGRHSRLLADLGFQVIAVDFSGSAVSRVVRGPSQVHGLVADAGQLPLRRGVFDLVVQSCFLDRELFGCLARLLKPGGILVAETFAVAQFEATGHPRREFCVETGEFERLCESPEVGLEVFASATSSRGTDGQPHHLEGIAARRP